MSADSDYYSSGGSYGSSASPVWEASPPSQPLSFTTIANPLTNNLEYLDNDAILAFSQVSASNYALVAWRVPLARYFVQTHSATDEQKEEAQSDFARGALTNQQLTELVRGLATEEGQDLFSNDLVLLLLRRGFRPTSVFDSSYFLAAVINSGFAEDFEVILRWWEAKLDDLSAIETGLLAAIPLIATPPQFARFLRTLATVNSSGERASLKDTWKTVDPLIVDPENLTLSRSFDKARTADKDLRYLNFLVSILASPVADTLKGPYGYSRVQVDNVKDSSFYLSLPSNYDSLVQNILNNIEWVTAYNPSDERVQILPGDPQTYNVIFAYPSVIGRTYPTVLQNPALQLRFANASEKGLLYLRLAGIDVLAIWMQMEAKEEAVRYLSEKQLLRSEVIEFLGKDDSDANLRLSIEKRMAKCMFGISSVSRVKIVEALLTSGYLLEALAVIDTLGFTLGNELASYTVEHGMANVYLFLKQNQMREDGLVRYTLDYSAESLARAKERNYLTILDVIGQGVYPVQ